MPHRCHGLDQGHEIFHDGCGYGTIHVGINNSLMMMMMRGGVVMETVSTIRVHQQESQYE